MTTVGNSILPLARRLLVQENNAPMLNKCLVANAWIGSYKIRDPMAYVDRFPRPRRWPRYNEIIQPPQKDPSEERKPATFYYYRENIKSSQKKMWHMKKFILGKSIDEAIKQCSFIAKKPAQIAVQCLKEAQEQAVRDHNFEYKSKMWIEDCRIAKGLVIKGLRKHARMRFGEVRYMYCHFCLKLTEGQPPDDFYVPAKDGNDLLKDYYTNLRSRRVLQGVSLPSNQRNKT